MNINRTILVSFLTLIIGTITYDIKPVAALPPEEDIPEEILRTEIITEGRSPLNGEVLTAAEYAELQAELAESPYAPEITGEIPRLIFLLRIRELLNTFSPVDF